MSNAFSAAASNLTGAVVTQIDHMVLLKRRPDAADDAVARLWAALADLPWRIQGIVDVRCGPNTSPEGIDHGYDLGFVVVFASAADRDAYLPHPDHQAVVPLVHAVASDVLVFDLTT